MDSAGYMCVCVTTMIKEKKFMKLERMWLQFRKNWKEKNEERKIK